MPEYVKNVVTATVAERQAIQTKSAQQMASIVQNLNKDLASIAENTHGMLSARNQKILDDASKTVRYMQQNDAGSMASCF